MANTDTYTYLEPLDAKNPTVEASSPYYFATVYRTALTITVALAFVMIVIGGVQYASSFASPSAKADANKRIWGAIGGLVLALFSYLILKTINPDLVNPRIFVNP